MHIVYDKSFWDNLCILSMTRVSGTTYAYCLWQEFLGQPMHIVYDKSFWDNLCILSVTRVSGTTYAYCLWQTFLWQPMHIVYDKSFCDNLCILTMTRVSDLFAAYCTFFLFEGICVLRLFILLDLVFFTKHTCICLGQIGMSWQT